MSHETKPTPYWWEAAPRRETETVAVAGTSDAVVVGAGFAGLSAALTLARGGRTVQVFDTLRPGEGASSRNGGIASGNIKVDFSAMMDKFGKARAMAVYDEGKRAREDLARFIADEGIDCGFKMVGRFTGAYAPADYETLAREADVLNRHVDIGAFMVSKAEQHAELGTDHYHGGVVRPDIGGLHPGLLHDGILARARDAGAMVHGQTAVAGVRRDGNHFEIETARGRVRARDVVVCTNGYAGADNPWLKRRIIPIPSQIIATEALPPETMDRLMPKRRMLGETRGLYHYYRPSPDGTRIIFGGRSGAETDDVAIKTKHLRDDLVEIFPELRDVGLSHSWWGYTGYTFDFLPKLRIEDGVHYATGFCGSGVVWARWLGTKAGQRILGDPQAETIFSEAPFETRPLYFGRPWFLPGVMAWYRFSDWKKRRSR